MLLALGTLTGEAPVRSESHDQTFVAVPVATGADPVAATWAAFGRLEAADKISDDGRNAELPAPDEAASGLYMSGSAHTRMPTDADPEGLSRRMVDFRNGYLAANGDARYLAHLIDDVIPCEYGWGEYVKVNQYESRAQFDPGSWASAGGGDPADDYQVGANVARWIAMIDEPGGPGGWGCW